MNCSEDAKETAERRQRILIQRLVDLPRGRNGFSAAARALVLNEFVSTRGAFLHCSPIASR